LVKGGDGQFYGTTFAGGTNGAGTAFKLNPDGNGYVVLRHFTWTDGDGSRPVSLVEGSDDALYGTTQQGGTGLCSGGTIFKLNRDGSGFAVLYSFTGSNGDGNDPRAGLLEGSDGALYGTTIFGGTNDLGTVFKLNKDGNGYIILRSMIVSPKGALIEGSGGAL